MQDTEFTQEQLADIKRYIPESDMVKKSFESIIEREINDWDKEVNNMIKSALGGDKKCLYDLMELIYLNAHNEGWLDGTDADSFDRT